MEQPKIHFPAVATAAVIQFVLGWLWYGLFFQTAWMNATGVTMESAESVSGAHMAMIYVSSLLAYFVVYYVMAHFAAYSNATTVRTGLQVGFWSWLGFVATVLLITVLYSEKHYTLWFIDGGYWLASMLTGGTLLAVWRKKHEPGS